MGPFMLLKGSLCLSFAWQEIVSTKKSTKLTKNGTEMMITAVKLIQKKGFLYVKSRTILQQFVPVVTINLKPYTAVQTVQKHYVENAIKHTQEQNLPEITL